jgi:hypothetical protein
LRSLVIIVITITPVLPRRVPENAPLDQPGNANRRRRSNI